MVYVPRPPRLQVAGGLFHVTTRSPARRAILPNDDARATCLELVKRACARYRWQCHAYYVMTRHYHLLITTREENLSRGMQWLNGLYGAVFNEKVRESRPRVRRQIHICARDERRSSPVAFLVHCDESRGRRPLRRSPPSPSGTWQGSDPCDVCFSEVVGSRRVRARGPTRQARLTNRPAAAFSPTARSSPFSRTVNWPASGCAACTSISLPGTSPWS